MRLKYFSTSEFHEGSRHSIFSPLEIDQRSILTDYQELQWQSNFHSEPALRQYDTFNKLIS